MSDSKKELTPEQLGKIAGGRSTGNASSLSNSRSSTTSSLKPPGKNPNSSSTSGVRHR